jgi:hypothetical protein
MIGAKYDVIIDSTHTLTRWPDATRPSITETRRVSASKLNVQPEVTSDYNYYDHYADDIENVHLVSPVKTLHEANSLPNAIDYLWRFAVQRRNGSD